MIDSAYCSVEYADTYLGNRSFTAGWDAATASDKGKLLYTASMLIDRYCIFEEVNGSPAEYKGESTAPDWLKQATCEQALYLATLGKDPTAADRKLTLGVKSTDGTVFDKSFQADVLCLNCRTTLEYNGGMIVSGATVGGFGTGSVVK